jgi:hypothetical protein
MWAHILFRIRPEHASLAPVHRTLSISGGVERRTLDAVVRRPCNQAQGCSHHEKDDPSLYLIIDNQKKLADLLLAN